MVLCPPFLLRQNQLATLYVAARFRVEVQLNAAPDQQVSLTDPDARSMKTRGTGVVGYNVQVAVDAKHHPIVEHEVTNNGINRDQLTSMAKLARTWRRKPARNDLHHELRALVNPGLRRAVSARG
jgi:hypothetical protein